MIYILIALALLAALTVAMSRNAENDDLSYEQTELLTTKVIAYAASTKQVVDQMLMTGTTLANINYNMPSVAGFDTPPHIHKVYHPEGGGLTFLPPDPVIFTNSAAPSLQGWYLGRFNNIEWTPTTAQDVLLTAFGISKPLCEGLNKKITGSSAIPIQGDTVRHFVDTIYHGAGNTNFMAASCPACVGYPMLCVSNSGNTLYVFYSIISAQ